MDYIAYKSGTLYLEDVCLAEMVENYNGPFFAYSKNHIIDNYHEITDCFKNELDFQICYALKANHNLEIIRTLSDLGSGFDTVSAGEIYRVKKAGGDLRKCTFAGVGKSDYEIEFALENEIYCFNVESISELKRINFIAKKLGKIAPVAMRVNPDVDAKTHEYISTGKFNNKFGTSHSEIESIYDYISSELKHCQAVGVQMHIGSQLTEYMPYLEACKIVIPLVKKIKKKHKIEFFSIGGGIGIKYENVLGPKKDVINISDFANSITPDLRDLGLKIIMEPGRFLVGNSGILVTQVLYEKKTENKVFKIIDSGMHHLVRPALYQAHHDIIPLQQDHFYNKVECDVVGPICESGDFFAKNRNLADVPEREFVAVLSSGAYASCMANNYNSHPLPPEYLIEGKKTIQIRKKQSFEEMLSLDI